MAFLVFFFSLFFFHVELADFGMACLAGQPCEEGDRIYMPPEFLNTFDQIFASPSADIFSFGITIYEIACGLEDCMPSSDLPYRALRNNQITFPYHVPVEYQNLIISMLQTDPLLRPSCLACLNAIVHI